MPFELQIDDPRWSDADLHTLCAQAFDAVTACFGLDPKICELSVMGCNDSDIQQLNTDFRDKNSATNVLSWPVNAYPDVGDGGTPPLPEPDIFDTIELGDIAIAFDTCTREAAQAGVSLHDHALHLLIHGMLHLLGYDHMRDKDADLMEGIEIKILGRMGIQNPYNAL